MLKRSCGRSHVSVIFMYFIDTMLAIFKKSG